MAPRRKDPSQWMSVRKSGYANLQAALAQRDAENAALRRVLLDLERGHRARTTRITMALKLATALQAAGSRPLVELLEAIRDHDLPPARFPVLARTSGSRPVKPAAARRAM